MNLPIGLDFAPMEARLVSALPTGGNVTYEPKWDGFRALCFRDGDEIALQSKSGQPLGRYFPEVVAAALTVDAPSFVLDGEIVIAVDDRLDFDELLGRIHPAESRVRMLAARYPATYVIFDLLVDERRAPLHERPLHERRAQLDAFARRFAATPSFRLSPATRDAAHGRFWYDGSGGATDGVVVKDLDAPYRSGQRDGMVKVKRRRTADCVVGGYRLSRDGASLGSILLGLYDDAERLEYVGHCSGFTVAERAALLTRLTGIRAESSFAGRIPGGPSRWNRGREAETAWQAVEPSIVVEVEFGQVTAGRFRHGTKPVRLRPDKAPVQCRLEQLAAAAGTLAFGATLSAATLPAR